MVRPFSQSLLAKHGNLGESRGTDTGDSSQPFFYPLEERAGAVGVVAQGARVQPELHQVSGAEAGSSVRRLPRLLMNSPAPIRSSNESVGGHEHLAEVHLGAADHAARRR
jgi:hypothetical protein